MTQPPPQPLAFADITPGTRLTGVVAGDGSAGVVTVVALNPHGGNTATLIYRTSQGQLDERIITADDLAGIQAAPERLWSFDADGYFFRLASEARRMKFAHLSDPYAAVDTSNIEPYPHQIDAVYNILIKLKPLRFVLADDPGAGKTIMTGLLVRELMLRGDVERCLIVAPGSLVEQWQDELWEKFSLSFDIMSRDAVERSRTGNPFIEKNLLIARLDQLSRGEDLQAKLQTTDWDIVIVDEAHKMSAHYYGSKLEKTGRFKLGEMLRNLARHFLLLTATPHNGKNEDFMAFMTLVDQDRFAGRPRGGKNASRSADREPPAQLPDTSDVMRRIVKENLRTFEGKRLFPKRFAETLKFELSDPEAELYREVTDYVRTEMNRAQMMQDEGQRGRGIIVGFALAGLQRRLASSPAAIYHSLHRRRERLKKQAEELRKLALEGEQIPLFDLPKGVRIQDLADFDYDDYEDEYLEELENVTIDSATASRTAEEIDREVVQLDRLVRLADRVRSNVTDKKWTELRGLLRSGYLRENGSGGIGGIGAGSGGSAASAVGSAVGSAASGGSASPAAGSGKLIVFTEYKDTLDYVADRVAGELGRPEAVVRIHGGIKRESRRDIQHRFRVDPVVRVLVATDAAGEGVNLQTANLMVNYDLPWNPNRIEQRFGRIHRIGQQHPCHLWNLVAEETREGQVFLRLFEKIEQQRKVYGDQVYDVLGDSQINTSLRDLLMRAITEDKDPAHREYMTEVIDGDIGVQLAGVLEERALVSGLGDQVNTEKIREYMERSLARKLQPWFVEAFFSAALKHYGGRITPRERGRYEITRVPALVRRGANQSLGPVQDRYSRVTFDKNFIDPPEPGGQGWGQGERAELISPGTPLLTAVVDRVLADYGSALERGAFLRDPHNPSLTPRLLVYLEHTVTDGRLNGGHPQVVSKRFEYVEIDEYGEISNPGPEPYIGYAPLTPEEQEAVEQGLDLTWVDSTAESKARDWAIENMAGKHFKEIETVTAARVDKVWAAVQERLRGEIQHWDLMAEEMKELELTGRKPQITPGRARARAEELQARLTQRRLELDIERNVHNNPPNIVGAALVIPQGLLDVLSPTSHDGEVGEVEDVAWMGAEGLEEEADGAMEVEVETAEVAAQEADEPQPQPAPAPEPDGKPEEPQRDPKETDRRAVEAVLAAEADLGRDAKSMAHSNPGYDVLACDRETGRHYFIEVKGHLPHTREIHVSAQQVQKARSNPDRWRLAVVSVPLEPEIQPRVKYVIEPFKDVRLGFASTGLTLSVKELLSAAGDPQ